MPRFRDREDAGRQLADALDAYRGSGALVCALPRGGVAVGRVVADALGLPLALVTARKIGHPLGEEFAVAAVTETGPLVIEKADRARLDAEWLRDAQASARTEARRRREVYGHMPPASLVGTTVIVVDDGMATGLTVRAATQELRARGAARIVVAVPCAPIEAVATLEKEADEVLVLSGMEEYLGAVGAYYDEFPQLTDEDVARLISSASDSKPSARHP